MKIVSCYIIGFGKFVNQAFDFSQNLNVLKADNGFGKTTLAAFIEAMLYGLDASRGKGVEDNARLKYTPWSGAAFGGSLTFLYKNQRYTIERTFGKTPSADECKLYDQNHSLCKISGGNGESLGEKLLGVDKDSFARTAYIPQGETSIDEGAGESLLARLSQIFSSQKERGDTRAIARLDEAERRLRAKRKPAKGKLDEIDERLQAILLEETQAQEAKEKIGQMQEEISKMQGAGKRSPQETGQKKGEKSNRYLALVSVFCLCVGACTIAFKTLVGIVFLTLGLILGMIAFYPKEKIKREELLQENAEKKGRLLAQMESLQEQAAKLSSLQSEEENLLQEKQRLEKRLLAIQKAKEILNEAKTSAALRYLDPVEKACKKYAAFLGLNGDTLSLNAFAQGTLTDMGRLREMEYYSKGMQELFGFCIRLALAEAVFAEETPPLILDDPLVHLDDEKTEKAKLLIREFSKKYQIVYLTCKTERKV